MSGRVNPAEADLGRAVLRVRLAQMLINERLKARAFRVPVHLALGHEAVAVAVARTMHSGDSLYLTHRNIHYNIARAASLAPEIAELRLEPGGIGGGRLGSMNMANPEAGIAYTASILGNNLCVAAGAALAEVVLGSGAVPIVVTGDGALEEGAFYEALELAASVEAPLLVVVENNGWSLATRIEERRCPIHLDRLAQAFDLPFLSLVGNDAQVCCAALASLRAQAVAGRRPAIAEIGLATLGDWRMPHPDFQDGKPINYHHGAAPEVVLSDWPVIRADAIDPIHILAERFGADWLRREAAALRAEIDGDIT